MSDVAADLLYSKEHEWVLLEDNVATIGITDHAQDELGDITFVELPADGMDVSSNEEVGTLESVKAASPVYSPIAGNIIEVNTELEDEPGAINSDPYGAGWIFKMEIEEDVDISELMDPDAYEEYTS